MWTNIAVLSVAQCVLCAACAAAGAGGDDPRVELGYPTGLMTHCPGSDKPARIPRAQLAHLAFVVQGGARPRAAHSYWSALGGGLAADPRIDFRRKTLVVAVGYLDSPNLPVAAMFANEYERRGYNVILVDYQRFATVHYHLAARLTRPVGRHVAEVLARLTTRGLQPVRLELLGFSLGGQTVGYIAAHFRQLTGRNVSAVTALEPAGPCFRALPAGARLSAAAADFVQVVHTNVDGYGMATPMGHVDFYVNGGEFQPSDLNLYPCGDLCSHFRVLPLWLAALRQPRKFVALRCGAGGVQRARDAACYSEAPRQTNVMGPDANRTRPGIYYLSTSKDYPYYLGAKGLKESFVYWRTQTDVNSGNDTEIYT